MTFLSLLVIAVGGYLLGSIPTGVLIAKLFGWPDPRSHGSGHTGGLNSWRGGGVLGIVLVMLGDILKGYAAIWLALQLSDNVWAIPLAGTAAVIGHNWPVWLKFKGGMGLATSAGVLITVYPLIVLITILIWIVLKLLIKHSARAMLFSTMAAVPILFLLRVEGFPLWTGLGCLIPVIIRHIGDYKRVYE